MIIKKTQDEIQNFLTDASNFKGSCDAVYFPDNENEIAEIIIEANRSKTPVTIAGNGTGLTGARVPQTGIVISTEKLNKILEINSEQKFAAVEPAVILADLQNKVKEKNLFYPPDPTETNCFIGGTIATNASGAKTFKYGATRNFIEELNIILPTGEWLKLKRGGCKADQNILELKTESNKIITLKLPAYKMPLTKNASGYFVKDGMDAIDLFVGSEGTLGIITKAKLRLLPLPEKVISCVVFFNDETAAFNFLDTARSLSFEARDNNSKNEIDALALEFFDEHSLKFLSADFQNIPRDAKAAIWFEQEADSASEEIQINKWLDLINKNNGNAETAWFAFTENDKSKIREFRHAISWKVNEYIAKNNLRKLGTDVAVPDKFFRQLFASSKKLVQNAEIDFVVYGHFGNSHMHLNMLPKNKDEFETGKSIYHAICIAAINHGGTISAEHGVGKIKTDYLLEMYGRETISKMFEIKKTLDPNLILGRGNIFGQSIK